MLTDDLRRYRPDLYIGQLGWTVAGTTDGYKEVDVQFDNGDRLMILTFGLARVTSDKAIEISESLIEENRNTRFDADPVIAKRKAFEHVKRENIRSVDMDELVDLGDGPDDLYAFTFPSLRELASLKGAEIYPVKIGYSGSNGAIGRVGALMVEKAGFPERPHLFLVYRTADGRQLETRVHQWLRENNRKVKGALGREWFHTNRDEVIKLCKSFSSMDT